LARFLTERGFPARRGQQFSGSPDSPDVVCPSLPFHVECKRAERLNLYQALAQAQNDADSQPAAVFYRKNHQPWVVIVGADVFLNLIVK